MATSVATDMTKGRIDTGLVKLSLEPAEEVELSSMSPAGCPHLSHVGARAASKQADYARRIKEAID